MEINIQKDSCNVNNLKMLYTNVRSLSSGTNREELQILIDSEKIDVVDNLRNLG